LDEEKADDSGLTDITQTVLEEASLAGAEEVERETV
jgi:hypothetical protein